MNTAKLIEFYRCPFCHGNNLKELDNNVICRKCNSISEYGDAELEIIKKPTTLKFLQICLYSLSAISGLISVSLHGMTQKVSIVLSVVILEIAFLINLIEGFKYGVLRGRGGKVYFEDNSAGFVFLIILHIILIALLTLVSIMFINDILK